MYGSSYIFRHYIAFLREPIHNILSTAPQLNISQKSLGTLLRSHQLTADEISDALSKIFDCNEP
jgi:hypothetical protein